MRSGAIFREAWRNIATGSSRARGLAIAGAVVAALAAGSEVQSIHQLLERAHAYRQSGASVLIVTAEGGIDGGRCDRLTAIPGVRAAGALRTSAHLSTPIVLPSAPIPVNHATPGFVRLFGAQPQGIGVLLGPEAAEALGDSSRGSIETQSGTLRVAGTYDYAQDGRRPGLSYAAIAPTNSAAPFDECWVDVWPEMDMTAVLLSTMSVSGGSGTQPTISQLNAAFGTSFDGHAQFGQRITRFAGACAAIGGVVLGFLGIRSRRLPLASALHAGVSHRALLAMVTLETSAWVAISAAFVIPLMIVMSAVFGRSAASETSVLALCAATPLWLGAFAGACLGVAMLKERYLFAYFKAR